MNDFDRNVWCVFGIPVDLVDFSQALDQVGAAVKQRQRCFLSTPNLNFIIAAQTDEKFRNSIIVSDLVVLDGMLPVWLARFIGTPGITKISGSDLFEAIRQNPVTTNDNPLKLYFFGAEPGVAARACAALNRDNSAIRCVGYQDPGRGDVMQMSTPNILQDINNADPDFVLVALGAHKGQAWIVANSKKLQAPVLAHLGAVINFVAGTVRRAPRWMQNSGLEWGWRIWQEPGLWRRYFNDAKALVPLLISQVLPSGWRCRVNAKAELNPLQCTVTNDLKKTHIQLAGDCRFATIDQLRRVFQHESDNADAIEIDLTATTSVDNAFLGLCLLLYKRSLQLDFELSFSGTPNSIRRVFCSNGAGYLL